MYVCPYVCLSISMVCPFVCTSLCMYGQTYIWISYIYMYVCPYVYDHMHVCPYVCMSIHMSFHTTVSTYESLKTKAKDQFDIFMALKLEFFND